MVSSPCPQFSYDARGHLQQAGTGVATVDFSYDAWGRRYQVATAFTNTTYQYDDLNIAETWFDGLTGQASTYLGGLGLDELFSFTFLNGTTNTTDSLLRDPLNSAVAVTDSSQALQDQYTYDPYGNTSDSGGNPFQFTGRENDGNGLYYMRGRYSAPAIGRFISRDPAGFAGGFNLYEYAGDDPVEFSDPTGDWVAIGPGLGCAGDCYGAWSGFDGVAIPHGFVGVPSISQLAPIPNINGFDIQQGRQTNGGLGEPDVSGSISVSLYNVVGGTITFGKNPNRHFFLVIDVGFGLGGGVDVNPNGTSPGYEQGLDTGPGTSVGAFADISGGFGPFEGGYGAESGTSFGPNGSSPYFGHGPSGGEAGEGFHAHFSGAAGARFGFVF